MLVPFESYLAIGYGRDMTDTEMVAWFNDSEYSYQDDLYSYTQATPSIRDVNTYTTEIDFTDPDLIKFESTRPLDPSTANSYVIPLD